MGLENPNDCLAIYKNILSKAQSIRECNANFSTIGECNLLISLTGFNL
jgi:hypothetical protein